MLPPRLQCSSTYTPPPSAPQHSLGWDATPLFSRHPGSVSVVRRASGPLCNGKKCRWRHVPSCRRSGQSPEYLRCGHGSPLPVEPGEMPPTTVMPETFGVTVFLKTRAWRTRKGRLHVLVCVPSETRQTASIVPTVGSVSGSPIYLFMVGLKITSLGLLDPHFNQLSYIERIFWILLIQK